jgi:predicted dienelactone hydrolase
MRPFEWLLFLSFIPTPLLVYTWRRPSRWHRAAAFLPLLSGIVHLAIEGWRFQMIPLYALALLLMTTALSRRTAPPRLNRWFYSIYTFIFLGGGLVAGWLLPVLTLPDPTGPYAVGIIDREIVDPARGRRLMMSVWYPAAYSGTPAPLTHHPDAVATALVTLTGLPAPFFHHLRYTTVAAGESVPVAATNHPLPVLVFSHGMVGLRLQNSSTFQELASQGYIVVALDHTDAAAVTVFPDGSARFYNLQAFGIAAGVEPDKALMNQHVFPVWVADQRFVYDMLEKWSATDALMAGKIDLTRIGSFGHSFGGATALELCRIEIRCRAAANLDGALYGENLTQPALRPLLLMTSADSNRLHDTVAEWNHLITTAATAEWIELPHSTHLSFTLIQLLSPLLVPQGYDPYRGLHTIDQQLLRFFNTHLPPLPTESGK